jgi:hypothetical protein
VYRASGSPLPLLGVPLFSSDFGVDGFASDLAVWMLTYVLPALVVGMLVFFSVWIVPRMVRRAIGHL